MPFSNASLAQLAANSPTREAAMRTIIEARQAGAVTSAAANNTVSIGGRSVSVFQIAAGIAVVGAVLLAIKRR